VGEKMISIVEFIMGQTFKKDQFKMRPMFKNSWAQRYNQKFGMLPKSLGGSSKIKPFKPIKNRMKI
jgi:hypothetical protein